MFNLLKYELRKTLGLKGIIAAIVGICEIAFLIGLYAENDDVLGFGMGGLMMGSFTAVIIIGAYSVKLLSKDLNTKQAYMLFMTPNNSYKILGAKVIENYVSVILASACFTGLAFLDGTLAMAKYSSLQDMVEFLQMMFEELKDVTPESVISVIAVLVSFWLFVIGSAFFSVVVSSTFLNGKKHNGLISFVLFLFVVNLLGKLAEVVMDAIGHVAFTTSNMIEVVIFLVLSAVMYVATAWIMDNKLSV